MSTYNWGELTHLLSGMNHQVLIWLSIVNQPAIGVLSGKLR